MTNTLFEKFTNNYSLSKTLRFELIPQGATLANIEKNGILQNDTKRADQYKYAKSIIDNYHKDFINKALQGTILNSLDEYYSLYGISKKDDSQKKQFEEVQLRLRKQIAERFSKNPNKYIAEKFKNLFSKELIKTDLQNFVEKEDEIVIIKEFENFTTYFTGFHENRANMYSHEEKATGIAYRLIHQNLPKFIDNLGIFNKIKESNIREHFEIIVSELEPIIQVNKLEEIFTLNYFNETLTQIGIDRYNYLLGGYTTENGKQKIKGLNEYINLYNQQQKDKNNKIPKLKPLFKQILSDRNTVSFLPEEFKTDTELLESLEKIHQELNENIFQINTRNNSSLIQFLTQIKEYNLDKIYLRNDLSLTDLSQKLFGNWNIIQQAVDHDFELQYSGKIKKGTEKYEEEKRKNYKRQDSFSIQYITRCIDQLGIKTEHTIAEYFSQKGALNDEKNLFDMATIYYNQLEESIKTYDTNNNLIQEEKIVEKIKNYLDNLKAIQYLIKPLNGKGNESDKDETFYSELDYYWQQLEQVTPYYNKVRNYLTRKPYSLDKIKLNFENSTLLDGWDVNKEEANTSILFVRDGLYYLGIMDKKHNKIFRNKLKTKNSDLYQKINYKQLPSPSQNLPRIIFSAKNISFYAPSEEIEYIRNHGIHTKNGKPQPGYEKKEFSLSDCRKMIDFFKDSINKHPEWSNFGFKFSDTKTYDSIDTFYREVENQGYSISYTNISADYIDEMVSEGKLYLFKIHNKDFSKNSKGTPNMHTLYWKMLFNEMNLSNVVYKLNGQAEVFYRKKSISNKNQIIHKAHEAIANKNELNKKKKSVFEYDIVKDKRFTTDKFQFHVPITINFKATGNGNINESVNHSIKQGEIEHIIGIDRGERHLLYVTVIDLKGKIKEQFSLNEIVNEYNGNTYKTNYHTLLDQKEGGRDEARRNWKSIETIKELKEGYLSQVIHKLTNLMVKYKAIIVLEDLNIGFMRGRQKVEKQVYQKFEKMLIDKLNFYVDKKVKPNEITGALHGLQLSNKFESFQKMGKQSGFLFYVPAWNTSKMDPVTGFVNLFQIKYETIEKSKAFFELFDAIRYNSSTHYFEFAFDYSNFTNKAEGAKTNWLVCTYGKRIKTFRDTSKNNQWNYEEVDVTQEIITLFERVQIDYRQDDLKNIICSKQDKTFFETLIYLFKLTLQMRNSISNSDIDYLISPVLGRNGSFFNSLDGKPDLPQNADANGAFNIARKGLWVIEQIQQSEDLKRVKLAISNKEWLTYIQL